MTTINLVPSVGAAARKADTLLVLAPAAVLQGKQCPRVLDAHTTELLVTLAREAKPGDRGALVTTLTGAAPRRLAAGVLPDTVSRYNSPARPEAICHVVGAARLAAAGRAGIVLVLDRPEHTIAALNAIGRALPSFSRKSGKDRAAAIAVAVVDRRGKPLPPSPQARATLQAARDAAFLVDQPPSELHPRALVARVRQQLRGRRGVVIRELAGAALARAGLGGIAAVGRSAERGPRLLVATWDPPRARGPRVALVGKGITFDTGGLHLKARGMMEGMKSDMGGAAAVVGAFRVLLETGWRGPLALVLCIAENAIGPDAYKPDDILTLHSGKTVEINNTDAEGRLVLGDGVSFAARELRADVILDAATLTGAQLVATGLVHAAVVSNDAELERTVVDAGYASGDLVHPLPFAPELYKKEFASPIADMRNSVKNRSNAQSSCAAQFIYWHIEDTQARWAHVDLAGPTFRDDRGTGFGVALLAEAVRRQTGSETFSPHSSVRRVRRKRLRPRSGKP